MEGQKERLDELLAETARLKRMVTYFKTEAGHIGAETIADFQRTVADNERQIDEIRREYARRSDSCRPGRV
jgi:hypothetical protein